MKVVNRVILRRVLHNDKAHRKIYVYTLANDTINDDNTNQ